MFSLVGRKVGMVQMFSESGDFVPVTIVEAHPNLVVDLKIPEKHGYSSVVVGYGDIRQSLMSKPVLGQYKRNNLEHRRYLYELKGIKKENIKVGDFIEIKDLFSVGNILDIQGTTRGHGFTGAIKKWNFSCGPRTHGAGYPHRFGGSLETGRGGASPQKVWKGKKMSGRWGNEKVSMVGLELLHIDEEKHLLFIKGSVPGRNKSIVKMKITSRKKKSVETPFKLFRNEKN